MMARITVWIDDLVLQSLRELQKREHCSMSKVVSGLLAEALSHQRSSSAARVAWISKPMHALVDLADKEALGAILNQEPG